MKSYNISIKSHAHKRMHTFLITHTKTKCATQKSLKKIAHKILTNIENRKKNHTIVKGVEGNFAELAGVRSLGEEKTS
jgi:hypothetical protein